MSVVVAPDKFAGSLTAPQVADAVAQGWRSVRPGDRVGCLPMSDGGPGFIDALAASLPGTAVRVGVRDPLGGPVTAECLVVDGSWYVESAQAAGLALVPPARRDPGRVTTRGVGELLAAAVAADARTIVVGLGGSATNDGGAGLLAALGAVATDSAGAPVPLDEGPAGFGRIARLEVSAPLRLLAGRELIVATDVDNPLYGPDGASRMFAGQKGATRAEIDELDAALRHWAQICAEAGVPRELASARGAGAAGGLGFALLALGGECRSGIDLVVAATGAAARFRDADLVITGEGSFDAQSLHGKVVMGVVRAAGSTPVVVVAGRSDLAPAVVRAAGIRQVLTAAERAPSIDDAIARGAFYVTEMGRQLALEVSAC